MAEPASLTPEAAVPRRKRGISGFEHKGDRPASALPMSDMEALFWSNDGPIVHKWHHYLPIYDRYLSPWRGRPVRMLEIGVNRGGSMGLWRKFLGPQAVLFGIDINPDCAELDGQSASIRIGSQADAGFLQEVVAEMGGVDIVLDDGSHICAHMRASLDVLFPLLSDGGLYMVEDIHTCYWRSFGGGYQRNGNFIEDVKTLIDDVHHWYHDHGQKLAATTGHLGAIHVYDSLLVLEKVAVKPPLHSQRGRQ